MDAEVLRLRLSPLTVSELGEKVGEWQNVVKAGATVVADAAIASTEAANGSEEKKKALDILAKVRKDEDQLLVNFAVVLDAWEAKGGDPTEMRKYAAVLQGTKLSPKDTGAIVDSFNRWLRAEDGAFKWLIKIGVFVLILLITWFVSSIVEKLVNKAMRKHEGTSELVDRFVEKIIRRTLLFIGLLIGLSTLGVEIAPLLAVFGGGAFILGFALQDTLGNFANGVMLLIYQPFDVGDAVEVGGVSGSVDAVSLVSTTIRSWDNKVHIVPNKSVWGQTITNINGAGERRVDMIFGISYGDDMAKAQEILERVVKETEGVLEEPGTTIKVHELADSSVNFAVRPWAKAADYWGVYWGVTRKVKEEFDKAGVSIPFPQQDVHMHQAS